jgi:hypothetical protein
MNLFRNAVLFMTFTCQLTETELSESPKFVYMRKLPRRCHIISYFRASFELSFCFRIYSVTFFLDMDYGIGLLCLVGIHSSKRWANNFEENRNTLKLKNLNEKKMASWAVIFKLIN